MDDQPELAKILMELYAVCDEIEQTFRSLHSLKSLVRGLGAGVDMEMHVSRLVELERRVHVLGRSFYEPAARVALGSFRLERVYWCEVMVATSALADWADKAHLELHQGVPYDGRERQQTLRLFLRSTKSARGIWKRLGLASDQNAFAEDR